MIVVILIHLLITLPPYWIHIDCNHYKLIVITAWNLSSSSKKQYDPIQLYNSMLLIPRKKVDYRLHFIPFTHHSSMQYNSNTWQLQLRIIHSYHPDWSDLVVYYIPYCLGWWYISTLHLIKSNTPQLQLRIVHSNLPHCFALVIYTSYCLRWW